MKISAYKVCIASKHKVLLLLPSVLGLAQQPFQQIVAAETFEQGQQLTVLSDDATGLFMHVAWDPTGTFLAGCGADKRLR